MVAEPPLRRTDRIQNDPCPGPFVASGTQFYIVVIKKCTNTVSPLSANSVAMWRRTERYITQLCHIVGDHNIFIENNFVFVPSLAVGQR